MNYLLDTHTVIWFITNDVKLPISTKNIIEDLNNNCFVSIASYWEIAIKHSLGRLDFAITIEDVFDFIDKSGFDILPITLPHILALSKLPQLHNDPFDRIMISQSLSEKLTLISKDSQFEKYKILLLWD